MFMNLYTSLLPYFMDYVLPVLVFLAVLIVITRVSKWLALKVPALHDTKLKNHDIDRGKLKQPKYLPVVKSSQLAGLVCNAIPILLIYPFFLSLSAPIPWWRFIVDIFVILMVYDFFYYLMHRFLLHGNGFFRKIHGVHHQARVPTYIDGFYVHPIETSMGLLLYHATVIGYALLVPGHELNAISLALANFIYIQINTINHIKIDLPYFPFKALNYITDMHANHHIDMQQGNYASITLIFDKLFGSYTPNKSS